MDVLKAVIYALVVIMSVNAISYMTTHIGLTDNVAYNSDEINEALNATEIVNSWGWDDNPFYDIGTGLVSFYIRTVPIIEEFPHMLAVYGCPAFIYIPILTIWRFMWVTAIAIGIIAGRQT